MIESEREGLARDLRHAKRDLRRAQRHVEEIECQIAALGVEVPDDSSGVADGRE